MDPNSNINPNPAPEPVPTAPEPAPVAPEPTPAPVTPAPTGPIAPETPVEAPTAPVILAPEPVAPAQTPAPEPTPTPEASAATQPANPTPQANTPTTEAKAKKPLPKKFVLIGAIAAVVVLLVILGIIFIPKLFKSDEAKLAEKIFSEDVLIAVKQDDKYGYIDLNGKMVIAPQFNSASDFEDDKAVVRIKENDEWTYALIDRKGQILLKSEDSIYYNAENDFWRVGDQLYDKNLKKILPSGTKIYKDEDGYFLVVEEDNSSKKMLYNKDAKLVYTYESPGSSWDFTEHGDDLDQTYVILGMGNYDDDIYTIVNADTGKVVAEGIKSHNAWADGYTEFCLYDGSKCSKSILVWNDKIVKEYDYDIEILHYGDYETGYYMILDDSYGRYATKHDTEYMSLKNGQISSTQPSTAKGPTDTVDVSKLSEWEIASGFTLFDCGNGSGLMSGKKQSIPCVYDEIRTPNTTTYEYLKSKGKVYVIGTKDDKGYLLNAKNGKTVKQFPADTVKFHGNTTFIGAYNDNDDYEAYNIVSKKSATLDASNVTFFPMYIKVKTDDGTINYYNKNFKLFYTEKD